MKTKISTPPKMSLSAISSELDRINGRIFNLKEAARNIVELCEKEKTTIADIKIVIEVFGIKQVLADLEPVDY